MSTQNMHYSPCPLVGGNDGVIGGKDGTQFNDITTLSSDGSKQIDPNKPFASIEVYHGEIIDGIAATYNLKGGGTKTFKHGSGGATGRNTSKVTLSGGEMVIGMYGKAGYASGYRRYMIVTMGFVIFNKDTSAVRTEGVPVWTLAAFRTQPFGDMHNSNAGTPYYASNPTALGGYANDAMASLGLGGLTLYNINADDQS